MGNRLTRASMGATDVKPLIIIFHLLMWWIIICSLINAIKLPMIPIYLGLRNKLHNTIVRTPVKEMQMSSSTSNGPRCHIN
jgi:hypothetical protein